VLRLAALQECSEESQGGSGQPGPSRAIQSAALTCELPSFLVRDDDQACLL